MVKATQKHLDEIKLLINNHPRMVECNKTITEFKNKNKKDKKSSLLIHQKGTLPPFKLMTAGTKREIIQYMRGFNAGLSNERCKK